MHMDKGWFCFIGFWWFFPQKLKHHIYCFLSFFCTSVHPATAFTKEWHRETSVYG